MRPIRNQRPGRSYLHGVLGSANRPFVYRASVNKLLSRSSGPGLRLPLHHRLPVIFHSLNQPAYHPLHQAQVPRQVPRLTEPEPWIQDIEGSGHLDQPANLPVADVAAVTNHDLLPMVPSNISVEKLNSLTGEYATFDVSRPTQKIDVPADTDVERSSQSAATTSRRRKELSQFLNELGQKLEEANGLDRTTIDGHVKHSSYRKSADESIADGAPGLTATTIPESHNWTPRTSKASLEMPSPAEFNEQSIERNSEQRNLHIESKSSFAIKIPDRESSSASVHHSPSIAKIEISSPPHKHFGTDSAASNRHVQGTAALANRSASQPDNTGRKNPALQPIYQKRGEIPSSRENRQTRSVSRTTLTTQTMSNRNRDGRSGALFQRSYCGHPELRMYKW